MRSHDLIPGRSPWTALLAKEIRGLLAGKSLWAMLVLLSPLVGYGFIQAVDLFAQASRTAVGFPEMAKGMTPLDGILVPTFGAFYLAMTLLFPFVAIRVVGAEKESGALKLLLQTPFSLPTLVATKLIAAMLGWLLALLPGLSAIVIWIAIGGHVNWPELVNLLLGQAFYALAIVAVAFFAAAVTESAATAAIVALSFTIGSWVLDFSASNATGWWRDIAALSLTALLRGFEQGLFSLSRIVEMTVLAGGLLALSGVWLHPGRAPHVKALASTAIAALMLASLAAGAAVRVNVDLTEDRRNSFAPNIEQGLARMDRPLNIRVRLSPEDPRLADLNRNVLAKLERLMPKATVTVEEAGRAGLFGGGSDDGYGYVFYEYGGRVEKSRSTSPREILPILFGLAGARMPQGGGGIGYPGYPLVASARASATWFYAGLPALFAGGWWLSQRRRRPIRLT